MLNSPSSRKRAIAPIVATHLPILNDRIANSTPAQMKTAAKTYLNVVE